MGGPADPGLLALALISAACRFEAEPLLCVKLHAETELEAVDEDEDASVTTTKRPLLRERSRIEEAVAVAAEADDGLGLAPEKMHVLRSAQN